MLARATVIDPRRGVVGIYPAGEAAQNALGHWRGAYPDREYRLELTTVAHDAELNRRVLACLAWEANAR